MKLNLIIFKKKKIIYLDIYEFIKKKISNYLCLWKKKFYNSYNYIYNNINPIILGILLTKKIKSRRI
jgi:hypothetical protein